MSLNPEFLTDLADKLHEIAADTEELTRQHVNFNGEIRRKATIVQVAANMLRKAAELAAAPSAASLTRQQIVSALGAMSAKVKASRMEMGFHEREAWRPLYDDETATAILDLIGGEPPPPPAESGPSGRPGNTAADGLPEDEPKEAPQ